MPGNAGGATGAANRLGKSRLSRRRLLRGGTALGALIIVPRSADAQSLPHDHSGHTSETLGLAQPAVPVAAMDAPLVEPEVRRSANGVLKTSLRCAYAYRDIGGKRLYLRSYEGGSPGPTLRMKPGETLKILLVNDFPPNRDVAPRDFSHPHQFNTTNFHFHGAHCSPSGIADNVMRSMLPGKSYDIEIKLPADHTSGTYWYHPHHHGSADVQVASGMAGAIVVEGDFADVPEIAQARERVMVLGQVVYDFAGTVEDFYAIFPETATRFLSINGQRRPTIDMRPGEVQRWRLVGAQYQDDTMLELDQHRLNVIAYDGIQLGTMKEMKQLVIAPGQRADVLVQAAGPGTYELNAVPFDQGHRSPVGSLARVIVAGEPLSMKHPAALLKSPLETIRDSEITGRRTVVLSTIGDPPANYPGALWQEFRFMVDGKTFDPGRIDQRVRLGAVEKWTIVNNDGRDDHVFHIHTNPFQVTQVNGRPQSDLQWRDSVVVPRQGGSVVWRSRFLDYTGIFMLHCHMMNHEEMGMMQTVEVYKD
jgi:FtsP/CotA-like multicopper oxidase with cupredoxin domain